MEDRGPNKPSGGPGDLRLGPAFFSSLVNTGRLKQREHDRSSWGTICHNKSSPELLGTSEVPQRFIVGPMLLKPIQKFSLLQ